MKEEIEWYTPQEKKPDELVPILVKVPSDGLENDVHEAFYLTLDGVKVWNIVHPMLGGYVWEKDIAKWAYMPTGHPNNRR